MNKSSLRVFIVIFIMLFNFNSFSQNNSICTVVSSNNEFVATGSNNTIKIWKMTHILEEERKYSWEKKVLYSIFELKHNSVSSITFTNDNKYILSSSNEFTNIWSLKNGKLITTLKH